MNLRQASFRLQLIGGILAFVIFSYVLFHYFLDLLARYNPRLLPLSSNFEWIFSLLLAAPFALFFIWIWEKQGFLKRKKPEEAQQPGWEFRNMTYSVTRSKWDPLVVLVVMGFMALFCGYALYIILLLPVKYDRMLPFTGTFVDRVIVGIAIVAFVVLSYLIWKRDKQGLFGRGDSEDVVPQSREMQNWINYYRKGQTTEQAGPRAERVAKINRILNYLTAFSGIILIVLVTSWNFLPAAFQNNPIYLVAIILAPVFAITIYDFWYSDEIRVLEDVYPDPSARLWLRVSRRGSMATPLTTAGIVVFFILVVCLVACSVLIPVNTPLGFLFPSLFPATACIVCILARVK